jgi:uncharacterized ion transporter superfamily protein YfcC
VTQNAKDKLDLIFGATAVGIAAVFGAIASSWLLFLLIAGGLFGVFVQTGLIRSANDRTRNKRR